MSDALSAGDTAPDSTLSEVTGVTLGEICYRAFSETVYGDANDGGYWHSAAPQVIAGWENAAKAVLMTGGIASVRDMMAEAETTTVTGGPCEARMANLEVAVTEQARLLGELVNGVNTIGVQINGVFATVGQIGKTLSEQGPGGMMRMLMAAGKGAKNGDD